MLLWLRHIPVIITTILHEKNTGFALGASDYLTKPLDRKHLVSTLNKYRLNKQYGQVLIVEDDENTRELVRLALQKDGWQVSEAENGRVGLDPIQQQLPEAIVLDLIMPEMDGFEFVARLRSEARWRQIPIIVLTAQSRIQAAEERTKDEKMVYKRYIIYFIVGDIPLHICQGRPTTSI